MQALTDPDFAAESLREALREGDSDIVLLAPVEGSPHANEEKPQSRSFTERVGSSKPLHGTKEPYYEVQKETPEHLVIAYAAASGLSQREIKERFGKSGLMVSNLFRQPWFQQRVVDIISEQGRDVVKTIIAGAAMDSVFRMIYLRDHAESEQVQFSSSKDLLDRHLGKAPATVEHKDKPLDDPLKEESRLRRQLADLERQERELKGTQAQ